MTSENTFDQDLFLKLSLSEKQRFLKKLSKDVKTGSLREYEKATLIESLVSIYFDTEDKDLKKSLSSLLQLLPRECEDQISKFLSYLIEHFLQSSSSPPLTDMAKTSRIEEMSSVLANFPKGATMLLGRLNRVLGICEQNLEALDTDLREISKSLTEKDKLMSEVLFTIQFLNKVLGKYLEEDKHKYGVDDDGFKHVCDKLFGFFIKIMSEELYYMDCLIASSIGITLLLKSFGREEIKNMKMNSFIAMNNGLSISIVTNDLASKHLNDVGRLPAASRICFINAFVSVIPVNLLSSSSSPYLVCNVSNASILSLFVEELLDFDMRSMSPSCKLIHSRTTMTLSTKLRQRVDGRSVDDHNDLLTLLSDQSGIFHRFVDHLLHHLNDPTDVIRHQSRVSLDNIIFCHTKLEQLANNQSNFLHMLVRKHLNVFDCSISRKYSPLICLVKYVSAEEFMVVQPLLIENLLAALDDQSMACHVTLFFEELWSSSFHRLVNKSNDEKSMKNWFKVWVAPVLKVLQVGSVNQRFCIAQFLLPKLFAKNKECLHYMTSQLTSDNKEEESMNQEQISVLVVCLKHALPKKNKSLKLSAEKLEEILNGVIVHRDEQLRLDGFSMLCEHQRTTEVVSDDHLRLILKFVQFNLDNQSPSFRQRFMTIVKKLFVRMSESGRFVERKYSSESKKTKPNGMEMSSTMKVLDSYRLFLARLGDVCFKSLCLGSSFPSRTSSLSILVFLRQFFPPQPVGTSSKLLFDFESIITPSSLFLLISILGDSFERNKQDALELLTGLNVVSLNESFDISELFTTALKLSESVRPQDCVTASHLIKFLLHSLTFGDIVTFIQARSNSKTPMGNISINNAIVNNRHEIENEKCFVIISWFLSRLQRHMEIASSNLLLASASSPMYPIIHCIGKVMAMVNWNKIERTNAWKQLLEHLIHTFINIADIVSVVVNDDSPEGNVPEDLGTNCDLVVHMDFTDAQPFLKGEEEDEVDDDQHKSQNVESKVRMMPEFLVVCCWRSIKETSLILGQISSSVPICSGADDDQKGQLSLQMVDKIGNFFRDQLLNSRHRGAFELAYAGFVQLIRTMWSSALPDLQTLPQIWVEQLMDRVKVHDNNDLCSTRRSAGVPFFFLAVTSTEPIVSDGRCLKLIMRDLISTASQPITGDHTHHIHSRNILRILFRDSSLGDQVHSFISDGLKVCIKGYNCTYWPVSNSSAMLFSILVRRIFGIRKPRAESKSRNLGMSGRAFFTMHPDLFEYFIRQFSINEAVNNDKKDDSIRRGTFMILIVLSNLSPSAGENSKSNINIDNLIPHVLRCSKSRDIKIREMAAMALSSLVQKEQTLKIVLDIFKSMNVNIESGMCNQNCIHGSCLQIHRLMESPDFCDQFINDIDSMHDIIGEACKLNILMAESNPCLVTRHSFGLIIKRLMIATRSIEDESIEKWRDNCSLIFKINLEHLVKDKNSPEFSNDELGELLSNMTLRGRSAMTQSTMQFHPYFNQYASLVARINLIVCHEADEFGRLCQVFLRSDIQDVQLETLKLLRRLVMQLDDDVSMHEDMKLPNVEEDECPSESKWFKTQIFSSRNVEELISGAVRSVVDFVLISDSNYLNLVQAMSCLTEILKVKSCGVLNVLNFEEMTRLFDRSLELASESTFIEVQEESLYLASHCCHVVFNPSISSHVTDKHVNLLIKFCHIINTGVLSETSSNNLKLASNFALTFNHRTLLVDGHRRLGCLVYRNWTSLIHLSQDEELRVREMTVSCIPRLQYVLNGGNLLTDVNPTYGTTILFEIFFHLHCCDKSSHWSAKGLQTFYDWLIYDTIEHRNQQDVRLFDRGELNPYMDETKMILTIRNIFIQLLQQTLHKDSCMRNFQDERTCSEVLHGDTPNRCFSCMESEKWKDSTELRSWMKNLNEDKEALEIRLKGASSIEIFTKQSTLQRLLTNYSRKYSAVAVVGAFLGCRSHVEDDWPKNVAIETVFNLAKYLMS